MGTDKELALKELLFGVWICFALSLIINLVSYITSSKAINYQLNNNDKKSNKYDSLTKILNLISIISLFIGTILLICFSIINY